MISQKTVRPIARVTLAAVAFLLSLAIGSTSHAADSAETANEKTDAELRRSVVAMKNSPKGPFESVRWFCKDGAVLFPRSGACIERGGGIQHGVLSERARSLRAQGFEVANVLASLDATRFIGDAPELDALRQLILERFLIRWDDGWIFRGARTYRGSLQIEDEEAAAERLMLTLVADPGWRMPSRFLLLRELARALPLPRQRDLAAQMRTQAAELGDADANFASLRARIHNFPEPGDAKRVREYARKLSEREAYETLARTIDEFFQSRQTAATLAPLAGRIAGSLGDSLRRELGALASKDPMARLTASARGLEAIRRGWSAPEVRPAARLAAFRASLLLETEVFASSQAVMAAIAGDKSTPPTRRARLEQLRPLATSLFGVGLLSERQLASVQATIAELTVAESSPLGVWRSELGFLARAQEWSRRWLMFQFSPALERLGRIEPVVALYDADRLRGSPLLSCTALLDGLLRDAQRLSGVSNHVLGQSVGVGLRGLNPGIARGILRQATNDEEVAALPTDSVALLPETTSHLPPVAAILTLGEGSSLSHVQLLARNLGIPNAVVSQELVKALSGALGQEVEVVVSRGGLVQIDRVAPAAAAAAPERSEPDAGVAIRVNEARLDLEHKTLVRLDALSASESGRRCGPKAANLGELRKHFGDTVPDGFVMPFGVFRDVLRRPITEGGPPAFDWLKARYAQLRTLPESERAAATARVLERMRTWITAQHPSDELRGQVETELARLGDGGVFVRSDTNVEDLPGFSGAGLNLTVANVVGVDAVLDAIRRVWASPFSDRAYAWRQAHMDRPELVFPSILVQHAFASEKSGVMVTTDIDTGDMGILSIAVSEGVGGAVDGQATESLRVEIKSEHARQLSAATAPWAVELAPSGGTRTRAASGRESLLEGAEIRQLIALRNRIATLPAWRKSFADGRAADVEFAFRDGRLALLQLRPLAESRSARTNERLRAVDEVWRATADQAVLLDAVPRRDTP